jgi:osmoprotectant transport system permease protein
MAQGKTWSRVLDHVWLTCLSVLLGMLVGVPLGIAATRNKSVGAVVLGVASTLQTIPSLALLVLVIPLATSLATLFRADAMVIAALVALFAYSLLPIIRNTKEGLTQVDPAVIDAATGIGMTRWQRLRWVMLPLVAPFLFAGIRTAAVIATGSATLAAFIGAGGLGEAIISGLSVQNYAEVLSGALPAAALALCFDAGLGALQWWSRPRGARS